MLPRLPLLLLVLAGAAAAQTPLSERSARDLADALADPNPAVRREAVEELGRRRDPTSLLPLMARLRDDEPIVRAQAAEALRALGDERAVPVLSRSLADPHPTVRCRAVLALGDLGGRYLVPTLTRMLDDPADVVRAAAVRALGEIGDPLSLEAVLAAQEREEGGGDQPVTACALVAAAKLGGAKGLDRSLALAGDRLDDSWFLRATAAHAMGLAGDRGRRGVLAAFLMTDDESRVCQSAAAALAALGGREELTAALTAEAPFRRKAAVAGIARLPGKEAVKALIGAGRDPDPSVRLEAADALAARGVEGALPLLIDLLNAEAPVWMGAMDALEFRTGLAFGRNPPRWSEWYRERRGKLAYDEAAGRFRETR